MAHAPLGADHFEEAEGIGLPVNEYPYPPAPDSTAACADQGNARRPGASPIRLRRMPTVVRLDESFGRPIGQAKD